jgi:hypothetical protein
MILHGVEQLLTSCTLPLFAALAQQACLLCRKHQPLACGPNEKGFHITYKAARYGGREVDGFTGA